MIKGRVVSCLHEMGMTQARLAEILGISAKHLSEIINGKSGQSIENATKIAKALNTSVAYLLGETDDSTPSLENMPPIPTTPKVSSLDHLSFGERLRAYRRAKDWGQEILAEKLGLPQGKIAAMEAGRLKPDQEQLQQLAEALEIPVEALGANEEFPSKPATQAAQDLDTLIKELASKNPDLVVRLRNTSANVKEMSEEAKQTLADGLKYVLGLAELDDLPRLKRHKER